MKNGLILTAVAIVAAFTATTGFAQASGADTYKSKCMMCHAADGSGNTPAGKSMQVPSLSSADIVKMSDVDLIAATKNGKGKMPAYAGKLTDAQIKDVVAYIRTLQKK
jgi:mono/diheme cytochrome c family protein